MLSNIFSEAGTCGDIMRNILFRQAIQRLHNTRYASLGFTGLDN